MRIYDVCEYDLDKKNYVYIGSITGAKALKQSFVGKYSIRRFSSTHMCLMGDSDPYLYHPKYKVFDDRGRERDVFEIVTQASKNSSINYRHYEFRNGPVEGIRHQKWYGRGVYRHPHTTQEMRYEMSRRERNELRYEYGDAFQVPRVRHLPAVYDDIKRSRGRGAKKKLKGDWHKTRRPGKSQSINGIKD